MPRLSPGRPSDPRGAWSGARRSDDPPARARGPRGDRREGGQHALICYQTNAANGLALHWVTAVGWNENAGRLYYVDTCETKADRAKLYYMTRADLPGKLRCVVHTP